MAALLGTGGGGIDGAVEAVLGHPDVGLTPKGTGPGSPPEVGPSSSGSESVPGANSCSGWESGSSMGSTSPPVGNPSAGNPLVGNPLGRDPAHAGTLQPPPRMQSPPRVFGLTGLRKNK